MGDRWVSYLAVDDVDARLEKATAAGAKIMKPRVRCPGCRPDGVYRGARRGHDRLDYPGELVTVSGTTDFCRSGADRLAASG